MITEKALRKARVLAFWEKHGLQAVLDAFGAKRRTLFDWKRKFNKGGRKYLVPFGYAKFQNVTNATLKIIVIVVLEYLC